MARVEIATQPWGVLQDRGGNVRAGLPFTLTTVAGGAVTRYTDAGGSTPETSPATNDNGEIPGFVEAGTYKVTASGITKQVEALSGIGDLTSFAVIKESPLNVQYPEYGAVGDGSTDDSAAFAAAAAALPVKGGEMYVPPGSYLLNTPLDIPVGKVVTIRGAGKGLTGGTYGTQLKRTGTLPVIRAIGSTWATAGRVALELHDLELSGESTAATVLVIDRGQHCKLSGVRVTRSVQKLCQFTQLFDSTMDDVYFEAGGAGTTHPAVLFDGHAGDGSQASAATVHVTNAIWQGNSGTELKLTGIPGETAPSNNVQFANLHMEAGLDAGSPYIHLDYAQNCAFANVTINTGGVRNVPTIQQLGTNPGSLANRFANLTIANGNAAIPYLVDQGVGALVLVGFVQAGAFVPATAAIHVRSTVDPAGFLCAASRFTPGITTIVDDRSAANNLAVTGSRGGNAALASLLPRMASTGLIIDATTA